MSAPRSSAAASEVGSLADLIEGLTRKWMSRNRKREVLPTSPSNVDTKAIRLTSAPSWPGQSPIETVADILPMVVITGMPPAMYPQYVKPLIGYTLATLASTRPHLTDSVWSEEMMRTATVVVATRAGLWAAINRVPDASQTVSPAALRFSARLGRMIMRAPELGDGTEIWRCILASCPGMSPNVIGMIPGLLGAAPLQFLLGSALLLQSGEVYAMPTLEDQVMQYYQSMMPAESWRAFRAESRQTWDLVSAAAVGGLRASVIRGLSTDPGFVLAAHIRVSLTSASALTSRLASVLESAHEVHEGLPAAAPSVRHPTMSYGVEATVDDDNVSVADTEALGEQDLDDDSPMTPRAVPPPPIDISQYEKLTAAIRAVPSMAQPLASVARNMVADDSVVF